jgi:hypothetical protein
MTWRHPVYLNGPWKGQDIPANSPFVRAHVYREERYLGLDGFFEDPETVTYCMKQFGFHAGGKGFMLWVAWCEPMDEPDGWTIARALLKPEVLERGEQIQL